MIMTSELFEIFNKCYPELPMNEQVLATLLGEEPYEVIRQEEQEKVVGYSIVRENRILLLCVAPEEQGKGIGSSLVKKSEEYIKKMGYDTVVLGGFSSRLFLGATVDEEGYENKHHAFFESLGYQANDGCCEMYMDLKGFRLEDVKVPVNPAGVSFGYYTDSDRTELYEAVAQVDKEWVQYFQNDAPVYIAKENGKVIGFAILGYDDITLRSSGANRMGNTGCVGVVPSMRKGGVGLAMVAHAAQELKEHGCDESYIHYTHLVRWYAKLGYKPFLWFWFGSKKLG